MTHMNLDDETSQNVTTEPALDQGRERAIAPWLHTVGLIVVLFTVSFLGAQTQRLHSRSASQLFFYGATMAWEWLMVGYIVLGIRRRGVRLKDLIGGRWKNWQSALLDFAIALGFWFVAMMVLWIVGDLLGMGGAGEINDVKDKFGRIMPQSRSALLMFMFVSLTAGFCEEIIFRGYLQRQFKALVHEDSIAVVLQAIVFGLGHGYQGAPRMLMLFVYGAMFGLLALWRKSLRPGMISHAWQDAMSGVVMYVLFVVMKK